MSFLKIDYEKRIFGLDVMRALAISLVVFHHAREMLAAPIMPALWQISRFLGVEIFFVLSGFLIGSSLIKTIEGPDHFGPRTALKFLKRRWYRTLPNYYFFLVLNFVFWCGVFMVNAFNIYMKDTQGTSTIDSTIFLLKYYGASFFDGSKRYYLFFLQNFNNAPPPFFNESWSLSIEEWFYLLLPISLLSLFTLLGRRLTKRSIILLCIIVFIVFPIPIRLFRLAIADSTFSSEIGIDHVVLTRIDSIMYGVLAAYLKFYVNGGWSRFQRSSFIVGLGGLSLCLYFSQAYAANFFIKAFLLPACGLSLSLLMPMADGIKKGPPYIRGMITHISVVSYSLYLFHVLLQRVFEAFANLILKTPLMRGSLTLSLYLIALLMLSTLQYKLFEKPIMDMRLK